jgi:hypothetical protein
MVTAVRRAAARWVRVKCFMAFAFLWASIRALARAVVS